MTASDKVVDPTKISDDSPKTDQLQSSRLIHVLQDGFTAFGRVWYRGQEIEVQPEQFEETKDKYGVSWLDMSIRDQFARFKTQYWGEGPWPGEDWDDPEAKEAELKRRRSPVD